MNRKAALAFWSLAGILFILAQSLSAAPTDARQLVEQLYTAPGTMPIRDLVVELECLDTDSNGTMVLSSRDKIYYKYPNKLRIDAIINNPGGPMDQKEAIIIRDGLNAWHYVSMGQYPVKKANDRPLATLNLPFYIQRYEIDNNKTYTYTGIKQIDGVTAKVVKIESPEGDNRTVYLDTSRNVPLRQEFTKTADKNTVKVLVNYKDIKQLDDGRYFPFTIEISENDNLVKIRKYKGVKANVGLEDSLFEQMNKFVRQ